MDFLSPFHIAFDLLWSLDAELFEIVNLSLMVSVTAVVVSLGLGVPLGALLASFRFPGRGIIITLSNTLLAMPPVVIGLIIYILISRAGPLGWMGILYTPAAMMLAQTVLVLPIATAISRQTFETLNTEYDPLFLSLGTSKWQRVAVLIMEARFAVITIGLVCFGRAISEVGAVMIVGGNIRHATRVMTTAISLETSRGELGMAMALGIVLMSIALLVNIVSQGVRTRFESALYND